MDPFARTLLLAITGIVFVGLLIYLFASRRQETASSQGEKVDRKFGLLSMPLLRSDKMPDPDDVARIATDLDPANPIRVEGAKESVVEFKSGSLSIMAAHMPAPVPGTEVQDNLLSSPLWKKGSSVEHKSHVVLIAGISDGIAHSISATSRIATAILKEGDGAGWYIGNASMVHDSTIAYELVKASEGDWIGMLPLWVNVIFTGEDSAFSASSIGLERLGHHEFEIVHSQSKPAELREWLYDLIAYVLERGPVLKHGQTFGRSTKDQWGIEVGKSKLGKAGTVIRMGIP